MIVLSYRELGKKISAVSGAIRCDVNFLAGIPSRSTSVRMVRGVAVKLVGWIETQAGGIEFLVWIANRILVNMKGVLAWGKTSHRETEFYAAGLHRRENSIAYNFAITILDNDCGSR